MRLERSSICVKFLTWEAVERGFAGMTTGMRVRVLHAGALLLGGIVASTLAAVLPASADDAASAALSGPRAPGMVVPAGTHVRFHLNAAVSSGQSKTGEPFSFTVLDPIAVDSRTVVAAGAQGIGTVVLAGHAGNGGHEGDLTLRIDSVRTVDGNRLAFADQRLEVNGRNRKVASSLLGFVPFAGMGAMFIRGNESRVEPDRALETVLKNPASVGALSEGEGSSPSPLPEAPHR
jgi:hypothetical protein